MKRLGWIAAVLVGFVAGCKSNSDCAASIGGAVDRMMEGSKAQMSADAFARMSGVAPKMKDAMSAVCGEDKWSPEVLACFDAAKSTPDINACAAKLTLEQQRHYGDRTLAILKEALPGKF